MRLEPGRMDRKAMAITLCECCQLRPAETRWRNRFVCLTCLAWLKARTKRRV